MATVWTPKNVIALAGAFCVGIVATLVVLAGVGLWLARQPSIGSDDLRPLLEDVEMLGGVPSIPEDPTSVAMFVRHKQGAEVAVDVVRRNARAAGWGDLPGGFFASPEGICAHIQTLEHFMANIDRPESGENLRRVLTDRIDVPATAVLTAVLRC